MNEMLPTTVAEREAPPRPVLKMSRMLVTFPAGSTVMFSGRSKITRKVSVASCPAAAKKRLL